MSDLFNLFTLLSDPLWILSVFELWTYMSILTALISAITSRLPTASSIILLMEMFSLLNSTTPASILDNLSIVTIIQLIPLTWFKASYMNFFLVAYSISGLSLRLSNRIWVEVSGVFNWCDMSDTDCANITFFILAESACSFIYTIILYNEFLRLLSSSSELSFISSS